MFSFPKPIVRRPLYYSKSIDVFPIEYEMISLPTSIYEIKTSVSHLPFLLIPYVLIMSTSFQ